eukprot:6751212-Prymnesium_polylepis.1
MQPAHDDRLVARRFAQDCFQVAPQLIEHLAGLAVHVVRRPAKDECIIRERTCRLAWRAPIGRAAHSRAECGGRPDVLEKRVRRVAAHQPCRFERVRVLAMRASVVVPLEMLHDPFPNVAQQRVTEEADAP